jgi:sulfhydrogenase subunit alpha
MTVQKIKHPIKIDHIARIEGKAGIEVTLKGKELQSVNVNIIEGPRFFEAITIGKPIEEATAVFPRICSFCAAAHKITALQAAEAALKVTPSIQTKQLRELMYIGDQIESHTLHLFLLALPDFLGFPDAFTMAKEYPDAVKSALDLKDIGAKIQTLLGSRFMHQENAIIGGFGKNPTKEKLTIISKELDSLKEVSELALELFVKQDQWPELPHKRNHLALEPYFENYSVLGEEIHSTTGKSFGETDYQKNIIEKVVPHSFAKHSFYEKEPFMTGAISRLILFNDKLTGRAKELMKIYKKEINANHPFSNNLAQAIELVYFIERGKEMTDEIINILNENEQPTKPKTIKANKGVAITEAPRGLVAYTLAIDKNGLLKEADVITPTAMFLAQMEQDLRTETNFLLKKGTMDPKEIGQRLETIVRSYDPCVSCSVHVTEVKD